MSPPTSQFGAPPRSPQTGTGPGAAPAGKDRPHLTAAQAADREPTDWLGDWNPTAT
ncbi:hypothetical protein [Streptomyces sp. NPDC006368]|uniref:hypothetical protein n=1 Tax=Streptomyces sp. NPDC006368 TaxID=3156760 RepID=UPI0033B89E03